MNTIVSAKDSARSAVSSEKARPSWIRGAATVVTLTAAISALAINPAHADSTAASVQTIAPAPVQALSLPAAPAAPVASRLSALDSDLLSLINAQRQASGLSPLREVTGLDDASAQWSQTQIARGRFGTLVQNTNVPALTVAAGAGAGSASAQSLAKWYPQSVKVADVFLMLKGYPDAYAKMTNPAYKYVGVRTSVAEDGTSVAAVTFTDTASASQLVDPTAAGRPTGALTDATQTGAVVELAGSASDPDAATNSEVRVTDTLQGSAAVTTSVAVTGGRFDASLNLVGSGTHRVCATVVNQGGGSDLDLGCVDAVVSGLVGDLQAVVTSQSTADITGWAVDPDAPTSPVTISVVSHSAAGDSTLGQLPANVEVPALAASFPGVGTRHGFGAALPAVPGTQNICAVATTVQTGHAVELGCQSVVVTGAIIGNFDRLRQSGANLTATGWGFDQATVTTALRATVVVTGPQGTRTLTVPADAIRSDIVKSYPTIGASHGFSVAVPALGAGLNKMCVTLVAADPISPARTFTCKTITVS